MYSILKEAGIVSYYAVVRAGKNANYITEDFPSQQFNHVILCVPVEKRFCLVECTSQTMPAGYLGDFTSDRYALLVDETGWQIGPHTQIWHERKPANTKCKGKTG